VLNSLLRGLPDDWIYRNEGERTFSPFDVVGHLIHAERTNWLPRARMILESGSRQPFEPFDRWKHLEENESKLPADLLDEFAQLRSASLEQLTAWKLGRNELTRCGRHPELGAVTLSQLLATWAAHDLDHLHQISRTMAYQYRDAVGPWRRYLGVMQCEGHGA
jgi:DinB superfamily